MNSDEARRLFEVRLSLDPTAAELAAARRTADDIATTPGDEPRTRDLQEHHQRPRRP
ncbi:hypothetical protein ACFXKG_20790 [Streptomyces sp. NPDC059255]|uniref:hypothetical protein n=1 Tax=Streptomyces sp. NPDC059255 TaxID=3346793 RepID=UPI0036B2ED82